MLSMRLQPLFFEAKTIYSEGRTSCKSSSSKRSLQVRARQAVPIPLPCHTWWEVFKLRCKVLL